MRAVNFIADPWEWPNPVSHLDRQWRRNYGSFRTCMHWLLLWYDEVWIQDTYAIFNRQFEHWFETARQASPPQQRALAELFHRGVMRVPIRQRREQSFSSVAQVYANDTRENADFVWYHDKWPEKEFFTRLDSYLAPHGPLLPYDARAVPNKIESAFNAIIDRTPGLTDFRRIP